ncbi:type ISP restriction/modification enzyme [Streptomyces sp. NPDC019443]|uniref:type ISP restriction/modification enzyme n=1 Tax=Streptomyces sp. NPDC019443 TaxID=3365061 RepID=UPI0037AE0450
MNAVRGEALRDRRRAGVRSRLGVTLTNIPDEAYRYQLGARSAIEWISDRCQVEVDKASEITNDPADWSDDPRYIINLLKRIVTVSLDTMKIVDGLSPRRPSVHAPVSSASTTYACMDVLAAEQWAWSLSPLPRRALLQFRRIRTRSGEVLHSCELDQLLPRVRNGTLYVCTAHPVLGHRALKKELPHERSPFPAGRPRCRNPHPRTVHSRRAVSGRRPLRVLRDLQ